MKGIVGKKLGMTQVFDEETGEVTPVTVIEAGPCPIVRVKTVDSDGYEAVQLAFDPVKERKVPKPRLGQLGEAGPHRKLVEFRGTTELTPGEAVTVETFEPGDRIKVSGIGIGVGCAPRPDQSSVCSGLWITRMRLPRMPAGVAIGSLARRWRAP